LFVNSILFPPVILGFTGIISINLAMSLSNMPTLGKGSTLVRVAVVLTYAVDV
jgi:hypothetical protein